MKAQSKLSRVLERTRFRARFLVASFCPSPSPFFYLFLEHAPTSAQLHSLIHRRRFTLSPLRPCSFSTVSLLFRHVKSTQLRLKLIDERGRFRLPVSVSINQPLRNRASRGTCVRAGALLRACVPACLRVSGVACLRASSCLRDFVIFVPAYISLRACVYQSLDRPIYAAGFSFLLDIQPLFPLHPFFSPPYPFLSSSRCIHTSLSVSPTSSSFPFPLAFFCSCSFVFFFFFETNYPDSVSEIGQLIDYFVRAETHDATIIARRVGERKTSSYGRHDVADILSIFSWISHGLPEYGMRSNRRPA